jgi:hypothetical protein
VSPKDAVLDAGGTDLNGQDPSTLVVGHQNGVRFGGPSVDSGPRVWNTELAKCRYSPLRWTDQGNTSVRRGEADDTRPSVVVL